MKNKYEPRKHNSMMILMRIYQYTYADMLKLQILFEQLKRQLTSNELGIFFTLNIFNSQTKMVQKRGASTIPLSSRPDLRVHLKHD